MNMGCKRNFETFKTLLTEEALRIVLDKNNYINSQKCAICGEIDPCGFFKRFHLYLYENTDRFITLHSKCVFREGIYESLDDLLQNFQYITYID